MSCCTVPRAIDGLGGVTASDTSTAGVTVNVVLPAMLVAGSVAVIDVLPVAPLVASPLPPAALPIAATPVADELQVTAVVWSWVVLSV